MIPVFAPQVGKEEIKAVTDALRKGEISGSFGDYIPAFEKAFAKFVGCKYGIAVSNGTTALHLAVTALHLPEGSEILVSACTNIATALAAYHNGHIPVPVDSEALTWNMDLDLLEKLITEKTKAIIPVHIYGHPVDMDRVMKIARKHQLFVIEDCAESHGAAVRGRVTGSFGDMGCFSFYANKIITTGEGGMITTNDGRLAERLRLLRNLAFSKPRFRHEEAGFNFRMTGYQAAMGLVQTKKINKIIKEKRRVAHTYTKYLKSVKGLQLPHEADWAKNVYWMYGIVVGKEFGMTRDDLMMHLTKNGIDTRTFFCSMADQPCLKDIKGYRSINTPVADILWKTGLYLPSSPNLSQKQIKKICDVIKKRYKPNYATK